MKKLILIRHGESLGNIDNSYYSYPDSVVGLTQNGINQAISCGKKLKKLINDNTISNVKIISSDLFRAKHTAKISLDIIGLNQKYKVSSDLNELNVITQHDIKRLDKFYKNFILNEIENNDLIIFCHYYIINAFNSIIMKVVSIEDVPNTGIYIYDHNYNPIKVTKL